MHMDCSRADIWCLGVHNETGNRFFVLLAVDVCPWLSADSKYVERTSSRGAQVTHKKKPAVLGCCWCRRVVHGMWKCISFEAFPFVSIPAQSFGFFASFKIFCSDNVCNDMYGRSAHKNCFLGDRFAQYASWILKRRHSVTSCRQFKIKQSKQIYLSPTSRQPEHRSSTCWTYLFLYINMWGIYAKKSNCASIFKM